MADDTRDRMIALEADVKHLTTTVDEMARELKSISQLLQQAKGARWAILAMASLGGFVAAKIGALLPWLVKG